MRKQLDEMDRSIKQRAESFGFKAAILLLAIWTFYESYVAFTTGARLRIAPCLVLTAACTATAVCELVLKRRMIKGDETYREPNKAVLVMLAVIAIAGVIVSVGSYLILRIH